MHWAQQTDGGQIHGEVVMKRHVAWVFGAGLLFVGLAAPASAQVHVDVGVVVPHVGARVVIGGPRVVDVAARREYERDIREARRDYERDIRAARRDSRR
jgi:hypothetical protein